MLTRTSIFLESQREREREGEIGRMENEDSSFSRWSREDLTGEEICLYVRKELGVCGVNEVSNWGMSLLGYIEMKFISFA